MYRRFNIVTLNISVHLTTSATFLQKHANSFHGYVTRLSHDVISAVYDVTTSSVNATGLQTVLEMGEGFYPADFHGIVYSIVLVIQVRHCSYLGGGALERGWGGGAFFGSAGPFIDY